MCSTSKTREWIRWPRRVVWRLYRRIREVVNSGAQVPGGGAKHLRIHGLPNNGCYFLVKSVSTTCDEDDLDAYPAMAAQAAHDLKPLNVEDCDHGGAAEYKEGFIRSIRT
jgi:hypothetical protein